MSNKLFALLIGLILLPFFGWMVYDFWSDSEAVHHEDGQRDVLLGADESMAQIQYLFHFAAPVYFHDHNTHQIEALSQAGGEGEHYRVYGLTQADYGEGTSYRVNWTKKWFKEEYRVWVENLQVEFTYNTVNVYVTSDYPEDSCEYKETLAHENQHVEIHKQVYAQYQKVLRDALAHSQDIPLSSRPIVAASVEEGKKRIGERISGAIDPIFDQFKDNLTDEQAKIDTSESYAELRQRCNHW